MDELMIHINTFKQHKYIAQLEHLLVCPEPWADTCSGAVSPVLK